MTTSPRPKLVLAGALLALLTLLVSRQLEPPAQPAVPGPRPRPQAWRFGNEEEWIVGTTVEAIAGVAAFASGSTPEPPLVASVRRAGIQGPLSPRYFRVRFRPGVLPVDSVGIAMTEHIWSTEAYVEAARRLLPAERTAAAPHARRDLPAALLDLRVEVLERENRRISQGLTAATLDAALHDEAALLLAAFALREATGVFGDARVALCRLAAHLALARATNEPATTRCGELAQIALDVLAMRQAAARAAAERLVPLSASEQAWTRALLLAATGDWRRLERPERASLLERLVHLRALLLKRDGHVAQAFLDRTRPEPVADWRRLMMGEVPMSIPSCHRYGSWGLAQDLSEMGQVWMLHRGAPLDPELWSEALDMDPAVSQVIASESARVVDVLDLGLWAALERRAVFQQLLRQHECLDEMFGLPAEALANREASERGFGRLRVFPILARLQAGDAAAHARAAAGLRDLLQARPDLVRFDDWFEFSDRGGYGPPPADTPLFTDWFDPLVPFGTAFGALARVRLNESRTAPSREHGIALARLAPYDGPLRWRLVEAEGKSFSFEFVEKTYAELAEYDAWSLYSIAWTARNNGNLPDAYRRYAARLCDVQPRQCQPFAEWLKDRGEEDEAARYFRKWVDNEPDAVAMSNGVGWLVTYEHEHGRPADALRLARAAAAVGSGAGLATLGELLEKRGDLKAAERELTRIVDRYENPGSLHEFYLRHIGDARFKPSHGRLERLVFPTGKSRVTLGELREAPADGVLVAGSNGNVVGAGLRQGFVIVALDGYQVRDRRQYEWIRALSPEDTPLALIAWNGKSYIEASAKLKKRSFGVDLVDYRAR